MADWDNTTFPGEVHFVRPTVLQLDPAQDVFLITKFPADLGLTRPQIDHKVAVLKEYGLGPSYAAFGTPDEQMGAFTDTEAKRLQAIIDSSSASAADKDKARAALQKIQEAAEQRRGPIRPAALNWDPLGLVSK